MQKRRLGFLLFFLTFFLLSTTIPAAAQDTSPVEITVIPGFDGRFRTNMWMPLEIRVRNNGEDVVGRLVVRPETSGSAVDNTYSTAVNLPAGAQQSATLYIVPRSFGQQVRVELIDNSGIVVSSSNAAIRAMQVQDRLYVVVTASAAGSVDLGGVTIGGFDSYQTNWTVEQLPEQSAALEAVSVILFSDVDTGTITPAQLAALDAWVANGGHLIVTGGPNWQSTAVGFGDLLPFTPTGSDTAAGLSTLARWTTGTIDATDASTSGTFDDMVEQMNEQSVIATGSVNDDATVLAYADAAEAEDGLPLLMRRTYGAGVVDYLAADPNTRPMRNWQGLTGLWFTLITSREPTPSWGSGFINWQGAYEATQIIPGFNLLPDTLSLCGFLAAYIALVGPLNYLFLNRINRREWAWLTIPLLIVAFSGIAWITGFNLRGSEVTLNRMTVMQTWPDVENAQVDGLVGLLAPRRATYTMTMTDSTMLRPVPQQIIASPLTGTQLGADIQQNDVFRAADFRVDASLIAGFNTSGTIPRPDIGGQVSMFYDNQGIQLVRGAVTNNSEYTLSDPIILARGSTVYRLNGELAPGGSETFDFEMVSELFPAPALPEGTNNITSYYYNPTGTYFNYEQTILDILGQSVYDSTMPYFYTGFNANDSEWQANRRQRAFLSSFIADLYFSTGRGDRVYLLGWTNAAPVPLEVSNVGWRSQDLMLVVVELEVEQTPPAGTVTIPAERFTWVTRARENSTANSPFSLSLYADADLVFRYTPLPDAVLTEVDRLIIRLDNGGYNIETPIELWNWESGIWEEFKINTNPYVISNPERLIGPQNTVDIHIFREGFDTNVTLTGLWIEQQGTFR